MKLTKEQLDYLYNCVGEMYTNRWRIGKDYFRALDEFMIWLRYCQENDKPFESFKDIDKDSEEYPF